jgi:hypothetical protein
MHNLLVAMQDNAEENGSRGIIEFFESKGNSRVSRAISAPPMGSGKMAKMNPTESSINSLMKVARSVMVESGLGGKFCFSEAMAAKDARNVTNKERI